MINLTALSSSGTSQLSRLLSDSNVRTTAAVVAAPIAVAGLHATGVSADLDTNELGGGLVAAHLWLTLSLVAGFGALGGVVAELLSLHGNIELPHRVVGRRLRRSRLAEPQHMVDLGIISRLLLGATAALAVLSVYAPTSPTALVVTALIAGSAATGVFRLVQARLLIQPRSELRERQRKLKAVPRTDETDTAAA
jgi:hypothetical protein